MNTKRTTLVLAVLLCTAAATLAVRDARADAVSNWGKNGGGQLGNGTKIDRPTPGSVPGLTSGVTAIAAGESCSLAVQNGGVYAWGNNGNIITIGQSTTPVTVTGLTSGVTAVAAGTSHALAIQNGAVYAWGYNGWGQLGGTPNGSGPVGVIAPLTSGVTAIAAGNGFSLAIKNGGVWAWGLNDSGNLATAR